MLIQHKSFSDPTSFQLYLRPREKYHHIQTPPFFNLIDLSNLMETRSFLCCLNQFQAPCLSCQARKSASCTVISSPRTLFFPQYSDCDRYGLKACMSIMNTSFNFYRTEIRYSKYTWNSMSEL